ncbi:HD domain-containing protein [Paenibacillus sp. SN-8-1]|uniref:HD domain-containing protein n=1 Tax=Paenibacillus sp. SN-8-1 TaxID=3435409 RepID=UPI003D9A9554
MNQIDIAIEFAARAYRNQTRIGTDTPYISHPFGVGMILLEAKCKEEVVIAGLLHDTLKDTDTTEEDIYNRFGREVLRLVEGTSEPDITQPWESRKEHTLEVLKRADLAIRQIACADKLHNLRSIRRDIEAYGDEVWNRFNRGYEELRWYYTSLVESLGYASRFALLDTFQDEVEMLFGTLELSTEIMACRRNKKFYDAVFEDLFAAHARNTHVEDARTDLKEMVYVLAEEYRAGEDNSYEKRHEMYQYLTSRGIEFEVNSEGTDTIISTCAAMKDIFHLFPHEVYHHLYRSLKRGIL